MNVDAGLAAVAKAAGIRNWWGDGPRPLNMPGAVSNAQWTGPRDGASGTAAGREHGTIVLEPTPAQLARGQRVLYIPETSHKTAMSMLRWAREHDWTARLSRSRYLTEPTNAGAQERRGRRLEVEVVALRLEREAVRGFLSWGFDVERGKWKPLEGLCAAVMDGRLVAQWPISITAMQVMMGMKTLEEGS